MPAPMPAPEMGNEPQGPMDAPDMGGEPEGDDELDAILTKLSPEQKKAVKKYAEGIADEDEGLDEDAMVTEITNNILDGEKPKPEDDKDEKVRNKKLNTSPFKSKNFG